MAWVEGLFVCVIRFGCIWLITVGLLCVLLLWGVAAYYYLYGWCCNRDGVYRLLVLLCMLPAFDLIDGGATV